MGGLVGPVMTHAQRRMQADRAKSWGAALGPGFATIPDGRMR